MKSGVATSVLTEWHFLLQSYPCCPRLCSKRLTCPPLSIQAATACMQPVYSVAGK
uniref:Uncharacterized protein n=1 Tax=Anguilla anguilla TaxID=7936 RepID=A0A0E9SGA8_ANGAN